MNEILRFLQIRPTQKVSKEETKSVALELYPSERFSEFYYSLIRVKCDKEKSDSIIKNFIKQDKNSRYIDDINEIHPAILPLYNWLDYKYKPIKVEDFDNYIKDEYVTILKDLTIPSIENEWIRIADNYLIRLYNEELNNDSIDWELLIKTIYTINQSSLLVSYLEADKITKSQIEQTDAFKTQSFYLNLSQVDSINYILNQTILFPEALYNHRCCKESKIDLHIAKIMENANGDGKSDCECKCNEECQEPSNHCICIKPYIADLLILKEELVRYEAGDLAAIENILAGETKVRKHRNLYKTETTNETETENSISEERDHQVSEKFSLQNQINETVQSSLGLDAGVTVNTKYGEFTSITAHANVTSNFSKSKAESIAKSYAKDIVDRSVTKINEKIRKFESTKITNELEEKNKHSINNADGDHRAGMYYWVNKITKAQIFNYGKHMMFDAYVTEPASIYKKLFKLKNEKEKETPIAPPTKPDITVDKITRANYTHKLNEYGLGTTEAPPEEFLSIQFSFDHYLDEDDPSKIRGFSKKIQSEKIPDGYLAYSADYDIRCETGHPEGSGPKDEFAIIVNLGSTNIFHHQLNEESDGDDDTTQDNQDGGPNLTLSKTDTINLSNIEGIISLSIGGFSTLGCAVCGSVIIKCKVTNESVEKWKLKIYNAIMEDYAQKLSKYEQEQRVQEEIVTIKGRNPFLNRELEKNELKRHIISILMCNYFKGIGSMMDNVKDCGYPEINFERLEKDAPIIQFFEQVLDWKYISYLFYHSMWARKCKWADLLEEDSGDPLFDKFLTAGAARVQIPIREGMEEVFIWFLRTGQIWGSSGEPPVYGDTEYVSMIQEIKESRQGDYSIREGEIMATTDPRIIQLTNSIYYWNPVTSTTILANINNDIDREIVINFETYRITNIVQDDPIVPSTWNITLERPFDGDPAVSYKHSVGAKFYGAPWEVVIPTKLVYLKNVTDQLPVYPLV